MGKLYLHGRGNKSAKATPRAKLTVTCPTGLTVSIKSLNSSLAFELVSDDTGKVTFDRLTEGAWDITIKGIDNAPTERIFIEDLDCDVAFPFATIYVTYPYGSICTCTNGDTVLTAPDYSGSCSFDIYDLGDWTVQSTNGVESGSEVVTIESFDNIKTVEFIYDLHLIDYTGKRHVPDPVEFFGNDDKNVVLTVNDDGSVTFKFLTESRVLAYSNRAIDITPYGYLYVRSVLDREGKGMVAFAHPSSSAVISSLRVVDKDTEVFYGKTNIADIVDNALICVGSDGEADTTMTISALSLRSV